MALARRRTDRFSASIWPGFVDAMTALLLVLMFVLSIFMIVQFTLRETITGQESELGQLHAEISRLADELGMERAKASDLERQVDVLDTTLASARDDAGAQERVISTLREQLSAQDAALSGAQTRIADVEAQVAALLLERDRALQTASDLETRRGALEAERDSLTAAQGALETALASARTEMDLQTEQARLAAAKREALEALVADLRARAVETNAALAEKDTTVQTLEARLSEQEAERAVSLAAADTLRARLKDSDDALTAMTLALEDERRKAEETLTLLAAAQAAEAALTEEKLAAERAAARQMSETERRAALLATARSELDKKDAEAVENQRRMALLNANIASLRSHLASLEDLLGDAQARKQESEAEISALGTRLNSALAQVAIEQKARARAEAARAEAEAERARLEEAERVRLEAEKARLEAEARDLKTYRSEFFGRMRRILGGREGIRIEGDRFVFSSEVLFEPASAQMSAAGREQVARVGEILSEIAGEIPPEIDWVIRVDGHTDDTQLSGNGRYRDNWELSQARALSVVRFMTEELGFPPDRLAANGFGEFQPVSREDTEEGRARNRRIELKLTER